VHDAVRAQVVERGEEVAAEADGVGEVGTRAPPHVRAQVAVRQQVHHHRAEPVRLRRRRRRR
jgi:hypothetical protein